MALPVVSCVIVGRLLNYSKPQSESLSKKVGIIRPTESEQRTWKYNSQNTNGQRVYKIHLTSLQKTGKIKAIIRYIRLSIEKFFLIIKCALKCMSPTWLVGM